MSKLGVALVRLALVLGLLLGAATRAFAQQLHWPPEAEKRYHEALQLSLKGKHLESAAVYREVADWPDGGDWKERPQALHACATELKTAHELGKALETYREVVRRFPRSDFVSVAEGDARRLDPDGVGGGLDYQKRWSEALDVLLPARTRHDRGDVDGARPGLEKSEALLRALIKDCENDSRIVDVAIALSETLARLHRYEDSDAAAEKAVAFAEREAVRTNMADGSRANLARAKQQRADVRREVRIRLVAGRGAVVLIVLLFLVLAYQRPWQKISRRQVTLAVVLGGVDVILAIAAVLAAEYVRKTDDPDSLLSDPMAAALVLLPGLTGIALAVGFVSSRPTKKGMALAAFLGVLGALAMSTVLVHQFGFDRLLPAFGS